MLFNIIRSLMVFLALHLSMALVAHAQGPVKWDHLKKLDMLAARCDALAESNNAPELRKLIQPLQAAATIVVSDPVPAGVKAPDQVRVLQGDLKNLVDTLSGSGLADAEVVAMMGGIDPMVGKLMEAAGMPHVHAEDELSDEPEKEPQP